MSGKKNKVNALVPPLRFPEFRAIAEWEAPELHMISLPVEERVGDRRLTPVSISAGTGFVPQAEKFGRDISGNQYQSYIVVRTGDFVYNKGNSLKFPQGCVYDLQSSDDVAAPNVFICFRLKDGYEKGFFRHCFENNAHGLQLKKHITSGARSNGLLNISREAFFGVKIPTPGRAEQKKIADCLSSLADLIKAESQKLDALKAHKKGLIQNLFPRLEKSVPHLRFPGFQSVGAWTKVAAGHFFSNRIERGSSSLPIYSVTMTEGLVPRASLSRRIDDIAESSANKTVRKGDIAYNMMRMWQGALGVAPEDCMVSPAYIVLKPQNANPFFFSFLLKLPQTLQTLTAHSRGLTEDRLRLYYDDFAKVPLLCPSLPEQERIADCLTSVDKLITVQRQKIDRLRLHKKGLMQQLFPVLDEVAV
ncbi:restriction endonuclease subunit S [Stenotrophomonas lactitubi]|uniref:restriction endonuclease subunit S n=1 Tax=Stenotrophomonas lactitubi TaxID=2045214 RepID=UPI00320AA258